MSSAVVGVASDSARSVRQKRPAADAVDELDEIESWCGPEAETQPGCSGLMQDDAAVKRPKTGDTECEMLPSIS